MRRIDKRRSSTDLRVRTLADKSCAEGYKCAPANAAAALCFYGAMKRSRQLRRPRLFEGVVMIKLSMKDWAWVALGSLGATAAILSALYWLYRVGW